MIWGVFSTLKKALSWYSALTFANLLKKTKACKEKKVSKGMQISGLF